MQSAFEGFSTVDIGQDRYQRSSHKARIAVVDEIQDQPCTEKQELLFVDGTEMYLKREEIFFRALGPKPVNQAKQELDDRTLQLFK